MRSWTGPAGKVDAPASGWDGLPRAPVLANLTTEEQAQHVNTAINHVWERTCRRFPGCVPAAVRPVDLVGRYPLVTSHRTCGRVVDLVDAFAHPVRTIHAVKERRSGATVDTLVVDVDYWYDGDGRLARIDDLSWFSQDPADKPGMKHTWWVEAAVGLDPPASVLQAAADLAEELAKAVHDPEKCSLPDNVQSIVRRGVTINFADPRERLGIASVDLATADYGCRPENYARDPANFLDWQPVTAAVDAFDPC